jgi:hypothetical protein
LYHSREKIKSYAQRIQRATFEENCDIIILTCIDLSHDHSIELSSTRQKRKEVRSHGKKEKGRQEGGQEDSQAEDHQEAKGGEAPTLK